MSKGGVNEKLAKLLYTYRTQPLMFFRDVLKVKLDAQQTQLVLEATTKGSRVMVKSARGTGKALVNGEPVWTPSGSKAIEELKVGELVCDTTGSYAKVLGVYPQGKKDCYRVDFNDGTYIDCSIDHLFTVRYKNCRKRKTISLEQILNDGIRLIRTPSDRCKKGYELRYSIDSIEPVKFKAKEVPIDPYVLGLWLGDGCRGNGLVTNIDQEVWDEIKKAGYKLGKQQYQGRTVLGLGVQLKALGINSNYSYQKRIPKEYLQNTIKCRFSVLQALMDTDGTIGKTGETTYYSTSKGMAEDFVFLVRSLGGYTKGLHVKKTTHRDCYVVHFRLDKADKIFRITRKESRRRVRRGGIKYIKGVSYLGKLDCTCISVDSVDNQFITRNFTPTHNTFIITGLALYFLICFSDVNIRVLSPSEAQLKGVFMREIRKHIANMDSIFKEFYDIRAMAIYNKYVPLNECQCVTASVERPESASGVHSNKQIYLIDEASAIPDSIYSTILGSLGTAEGGGHVIGTSNPTKSAGFYGDLFIKKPKSWKLLTFTAFKCSMISDAFIEEQKELYGEDGDEYRVSVLGEFPRADGSTFIPSSIVDEAALRANLFKDNHHQRIVMGVDVARSLSGDSSVLCVRQGTRVLDLISFQTADTMEVVARVRDAVSQHKVNVIYVDATGVGGGVADRAREVIQNVPVIDVMVANKSADPVQYANLRSQLWGELRNWLMDGDIPEHYLLKKELSSMTWGYSGKMQIQLTAKKQLRNKGIQSPDHADALALTMTDVASTIRRRRVTLRKVKRANFAWI